MFNQGVHTYRKVNVTTSNSVQLIVMCYEGAINNLKIAKQKYNENDFEAKGKAIKKFMEIIAELQCALDFEKGAEVAKNLDAVYNFMTHTIVKADMNKDLAAIDTVINMLSELMSAWETLQKKQHESPPEMPGEFAQNNSLKKQGHIAA
jgi:flagellar protein FliS